MNSDSATSALTTTAISTVLFNDDLIGVLMNKLEFNSLRSLAQANSSFSKNLDLKKLISDIGNEKMAMYVYELVCMKCSNGFLMKKRDGHEDISGFVVDFHFAKMKLYRVLLTDGVKIYLRKIMEDLKEVDLDSYSSNEEVRVHKIIVKNLGRMV